MLAMDGNGIGLHFLWVQIPGLRRVPFPSYIFAQTLSTMGGWGFEDEHVIYIEADYPEIHFQTSG